MTSNTEAVRASFAEIEAMAREERKLHPGHLHYQEVDAALNALRENVRAYLGAAGFAQPAKAEHLRAQAAIVVAQARPVWEARLDAAKAERERVRRNTVTPQREYFAQMMGVYPPGRGADVKDAACALKLRLDTLECDLTKGDEAAFNGVLDAMEAATAAFRSSIGIARRESRLRVSEELARAAVSAVSAEGAAA